MPPLKVAPPIDYHESKQATLRALLTTMMVLPTVIILFRFWSRALSPTIALSQTPTRFWWDDWTALAAVVLNIIVCGIGLELVHLGLGLHVRVINPANIEPFFKLLWVEYYLFETGTAVAKTSALFFYARVFGVVHSWFRYALWVVHLMNVGQLIGALFDVLLECLPIEKAWKVAIPGHCIDTGDLWLGNGISSLVVHIIILLMPLPMLCKMQMKLARKIQVILVFVCGYLAVIVSIGRLVTTVGAGPGMENDPTFNLATPALWPGAEIAVSVTSVSLSSLLVLAQKAYREGAWSLCRTRARGPTSKPVVSRDGNNIYSHGPSHDRDDVSILHLAT